MAEWTDAEIRAYRCVTWAERTLQVFLGLLAIALMAGAIGH